MNYISTRGYDRKYSAAEAIITGIAPDGGLFVPETIPHISAEEIEEMKNMQFFQISARVLSKYLTDFTEAELLEFAQAAYDEEKWGENPIPLVQMKMVQEADGTVRERPVQVLTCAGWVKAAYPYAPGKVTGRDAVRRLCGAPPPPRRGGRRQRQGVPLSGVPLPHQYPASRCGTASCRCRQGSACQ